MRMVVFVMPKKRVSKITTITRTEFTDGSSSETVEITETKSTSVYNPASMATITISPIEG